MTWRVQALDNGENRIRRGTELFGVVLLVDISEMGGDRVGLSNLCKMIEDMNVKYKTKKLSVGDYSWGWHTDGTERTLPFLVERKRADDVARTLKEGRFWNQVTKMVEWKSQFINQGLQCQLQYIIEGEPEQYMVKCMDGCQGVGMCGNPTVTQVKNALKDLTSHPDICVQYTEDIQDTVVMLASISADLEMRVRKGEFDDMVVKELNSACGVKQREFYVVDSDDDGVTIVDDVCGRSSPNSDVMIEESVETTEMVLSPNKKCKPVNILYDNVEPSSGDKKMGTCCSHSCRDSKASSQSSRTTDVSKYELLDSVPESRFSAVGKVEPYCVDDLEEIDLTKDKRKKSTIPFKEFPLEPLVQYHCSGGKHTPPKRRATPSKYHGKGAYIPKLDYTRDDDPIESRFIKHAQGTYVPKLDYKKGNNKNQTLASNFNPRIDYGRKGTNQIESGFENTSSFRNDATNKTNFKNNLGHGTLCARYETTGTKHKMTFSDASISGAKKFHPPTKTFKMASNVNCRESGIGKSPSDLGYEQPSTSTKGYHSYRKRNLSRDSAISSEDESNISDTSTRKKIDDFIKTVKSRDKVDSAIESDYESLPNISNINKEHTSQDFGNSRLSVRINLDKPEHDFTSISEDNRFLAKGQKFKSDNTMTAQQKQYIETVEGIFPQIATQQIQAALEQNRWNVDTTIAELLDL